MLDHIILNGHRYLIVILLINDLDIEIFLLTLVV
jgi:hypothetical protein